MYQQVCQIAMLVLIFIGFFMNLCEAIEGAPKKEPKGFKGVLAVFFVTGCSAALFYGSGLFSTLLR